MKRSILVVAPHKGDRRETDETRVLVVERSRVAQAGLDAPSVTYRSRVARRVDECDLARTKPRCADAIVGRTEGETVRESYANR